jgi:hypothetical protein
LLPALFGCNVQPRFDQGYQRGVADAPCDTLNHFAVRYGIKATVEASVDSLQQSVHLRETPQKTIKASFKVVIKALEPQNFNALMADRVHRKNAATLPPSTVVTLPVVFIANA